MHISSGVHDDPHVGMSVGCVDGGAACIVCLAGDAQNAAQLEKDKARATSSAVTQKLEDEIATLRQENDILLKAHHESKQVPLCHST